LQVCGGGKFTASKSPTSCSRQRYLYSSPPQKYLLKKHTRPLTQNKCCLACRFPFFSLPPATDKKVKQTAIDKKTNSIFECLQLQKYKYWLIFKETTPCL